MNYAFQLKELLRPLGLYALEGGVAGAELESIGAALDAVYAMLDLAERDANPLTAEAGGLRKWEALLPFAPESPSEAARRRGVAALLRIDGGSFTAAGINDTIAGCGIRAVVEEAAEHMTVRVSFPYNRGIPDGIEEIRSRIEEIVPCHLAVEYFYVYPTWLELEALFALWNALDGVFLWRDVERCGGEEE